MNFVEVEGTSIDDAIDKALQSLGVSREQVEIEILTSPTKGLLGIGARRAKVRATIRPPMSLDPFGDTPRTEAVVPAAPRVDPEPSVMTPPSTPGTDDGVGAARAQALLQEILDRMGFAVSVAVAVEDGAVRLSINGDSSGALIGRHGQTLDALEYLLQRMLSREEEVGRVSVDCENYRVRRHESLQAMAARLAQQAKAKGKPMAMEALSPRDRRVIHLALQDDPGLTTRSSGEGYYRKLLIIPNGARAARPPRPGNRSGNR